MPKSHSEQDFPADTIRTWVEWACNTFDDADIYFGHGTDNALDEAVYLVSHALETDFDFSGYQIDKPLSMQQNQAVHDLLLTRVQTRKPAAYLTGEAWFAGYPFYVNEHVLVPRSPLAELIADGFAPWIDSQIISSVIDVGTGSGCIAIACALHLPQAHVDAVDVDDNALSIANKNIQRYELQDRVKAFKSDMLNQVPPTHYDIIISNPPYVSFSEYASLPVEYHREPQLGLTSGADGLDCTRQLLKMSKQYLSEQGILIVEVGNSAHALEQAYPDVPFTWLEFEHGGSGVFLLDKQQIEHYSSYLQA